MHPDITTVFPARPNGRFIEIIERFIEKNKARVFLKAVLAIETMYEPQSNVQAPIEFIRENQPKQLKG